MLDLRSLYQEVIIDHNRHPRNFGHLDHPTHHAEGFNPLCGDKITIDVEVTDGVITQVKFEGEGCAISTASASLMTESLLGKTLAEADQLFTLFHDVIVNDKPVDVNELGKLAVLAGVKEYPTRIKCATLAWHAIQAALHQQQQTVSTE
jgi:nitrogen fixation NifU-like protein